MWPAVSAVDPIETKKSNFQHSLCAFARGVAIELIFSVLLSGFNNVYWSCFYWFIFVKYLVVAVVIATADTSYVAVLAWCCFYGRCLCLCVCACVCTHNVWYWKIINGVYLVYVCGLSGFDLFYLLRLAECKGHIKKCGGGNGGLLCIPFFSHSFSKCAFYGSIYCR